MVSRFGDAWSSALPLPAARPAADPLAIASVTACGYAPWLLFGLLGGAVADRVDQRRAMWAVDTVRGLLVAAFALAVALGHASIPLLLLLAFALTTLQTLFANAATALLVAGTVQTSSLLLMGTVRHLGALVAGMLLLGAMNVVWNVDQVTLMQQRAPGSMTGRIAAAFRTSSTSGAPLGALLGGAVAGACGLNAPALLAAVLIGLAVTSLIPVRKPDVPVVAPRDGATAGRARS
ncbi:hypothetical protein [Streptomyces sp900105755]|uniref:MFS transporter n=1 Tax=Streptomyces sp. 900105755 TaxID=3154389 RepID=A0ABV1TK50_9ACTN